MTKIKITQVKSGIDRPERQKLTLRALGLNKMNASREVEASAQILGMVRKVNHLIKIEEMEGVTETLVAFPPVPEVVALENEVAVASADPGVVAEITQEDADEQIARPEQPVENSIEDLRKIDPEA